MNTDPIREVFIILCHISIPILLAHLAPVLSLTPWACPRCVVEEQIINALDFQVESDNRGINRAILGSQASPQAQGEPFAVKGLWQHGQNRTGFLLKVGYKVGT